MPQVQNQPLLSALGMALLAARTWGESHSRDDAFKAEEHPEFFEASIPIEQAATQPLVSISDEIEQWIELEFPPNSPMTVPDGQG